MGPEENYPSDVIPDGVSRSGTLIRKLTKVPALHFAPAGMRSWGSAFAPLPSPQSQVTHIGVGFAFPAEIADLAMARYKVDVIAIGPQLARDGGDQIVEIAFGKIGAADRALEQKIADKGEFGVLIDDGDMARRVAGTVDNIKLMASEFELVAIFEIAGWHTILIAGGLAIFRPLRHDIVEQPLVILMWANDVDAEGARQFLRTTGMVQMAMGQPDRDHLHAQMLHRPQQARYLTTWINKHRLFGGLRPQKRRVLLKRGNGDDGGLQVRWIGHGGVMKEARASGKQVTRTQRLCRLYIES